MLFVNTARSHLVPAAVVFERVHQQRPHVIGFLQTTEQDLQEETRRYIAVMSQQKEDKEYKRGRKTKWTSDLQCAADSVKIQRLLLHEAGVAALRQPTGPEFLEEGGRVEDLHRQHVALTPHDVKQTHIRDHFWERESSNINPQNIMYIIKH